MSVDAVWARARPFLEEALLHCGGTHELEDVVKAIGEGRLQLWLGERSAGVSEILTYPRKRVLNLFLAGGNLEEMKALRPGLEAFARGHACDGVMFSGRLTAAARRASGWSRAWQGYAPTHLTFCKEL
jgi:hypothetical protein